MVGWFGFNLPLPFLPGQVSQIRNTPSSPLSEHPFSSTSGKRRWVGTSSPERLHVGTEPWHWCRGCSCCLVPSMSPRAPRAFRGIGGAGRRTQGWEMGSAFSAPSPKVKMWESSRYELLPLSLWVGCRTLLGSTAVQEPIQTASELPQTHGMCREGRGFVGQGAQTCSHR